MLLPSPFRARQTTKIVELVLGQVSKLVAGGAAAASGRVHQGDMLDEIDGEDVRKWPLAEVRGKVLGEPGSVVVLTLASADGGRETVRLVRR